MNIPSAITLQRALVSASGNSILTDNQFECIQDALSGLNMGEIAYTQWYQSWLVQTEGNMSEGDVEYMDTVGWIVNFVSQLENNV